MPSFPHIYRETSAGNMLYAWFSAMHSRVDIMLLSIFDEEKMLGIIAEIRSRIAEIETLGNCFNPESELSLYNDKVLDFSSLSPELQRILTSCEDWKGETEGLFDVSVEGKINLSGFLKGYALDEIKPILENHEIQNALINLGNSSILALGSQNGKDDGWKVKNLNGGEFVLKNECLTTSGNDSETRKHIINPTTGEYILGKRLVSVVSSSGAEGEVKSTVAFIRSNA